MKKWVYALIFALLLAACMLTCLRVRWVEAAGKWMRRRREGLNEASAKRLLENRRQLLMLQKKHSGWYRLEQELNYSGLKRKLPFLTAELWAAFNVLAVAVLAAVTLVGFGWSKMLLVVAGFLGGEYVILQICKARAFRRVNTNLIKFLDFLGNYSITAGELTGIFTQISKYLDEPLRSALDECSYEAQTTGDAGLALLSMAEKIEHPKFKELARNMEISVRYCADFTLLVNSSRRIVREYLRMGEERKGMMREAVINMLLLLAMSGFTLAIVDGLIDASVWVLLRDTVPGRIALGVTAFIICLFLRKIAERR